MLSQLLPADAVCRRVLELPPRRPWRLPSRPTAITRSASRPFQHCFKKCPERPSGCGLLGVDFCKQTALEDEMQERDSHIFRNLNRTTKTLIAFVAVAGVAGNVGARAGDHCHNLRSGSGPVRRSDSGSRRTCCQRSHGRGEDRGVERTRGVRRRLCPGWSVHDYDRGVRLHDARSVGCEPLLRPDGRSQFRAGNRRDD